MKLILNFAFSFIQSQSACWGLKTNKRCEKQCKCHFFKKIVLLTFFVLYISVDGLHLLQEIYVFRSLYVFWVPSKTYLKLIIWIVLAHNFLILTLSLVVPDWEGSVTLLRSCSQFFWKTHVMSTSSHKHNFDYSMKWNLWLPQASLNTQTLSLHPLQAWMRLHPINTN